MNGLLFPFKDLIDECEAIKGYASGFLDNTTVNVLAEAKGALESLQQSDNRNLIKWQIYTQRPLRTIWSDGESQPGNKSKHKICAAFSFVWQIRKFNEDGKIKKSKYFLLEGLASTVTSIIANVDGAEQEIARWTTEVGDHQSPGTHFHFQVNRPNSDEFPFPKSLDVPRLPAPMMSPFLVIDLALGELFQDRWKRQAIQDNTFTKRWRNLHGKRLTDFFEWQVNIVKKSVGSPWMALKVAKPERTLFVGDV